jgi:hypothetical protein
MASHWVRQTLGCSIQCLRSFANSVFFQNYAMPFLFSFPTRRGAVALVLGSTLGIFCACSLVFRTSDQCSSDDDCKVLGVVGARCVSNTCLSPTTSDATLPKDAGSSDGDLVDAPSSDAAPDPFACGTKPPQGVDQTKQSNLTIRFLDFSLGAPASKIDARLCAVTDPLCANPRSKVSGTADAGPGSGSGLDAGADGGAGWVAPGDDGTILASAEYGFEGYFEVRSSEYAPALRFTSPPLNRPNVLMDQILLRRIELQVLATQATGNGDSYDDKTRGIVFLLVRDCDERPLANIRFTINSQDSKHFPFYLINTSPSITDTRTDGTGRAGYANVLPGVYTFTAEFADTGKRLGSARAIVRAGHTTTVAILPSL